MEHYVFEERLPDEALARPTWQPFIRHGKIAYRAASGSYAGRVVDVDEWDRSAVKGFAGGAGSASKFSAELAHAAIPYVGPLLLVGQAAAGRTIWGERLALKGRVVLGLFALLGPALRLAKATPEAELQLARQETAARGISERDGLQPTSTGPHMGPLDAIRPDHRLRDHTQPPAKPLDIIRLLRRHERAAPK